MPSSSARRTWVIPWFSRRRRTVDPNRRFRCLHCEDFVCIATWLLCLRAIELQHTIVRERHKKRGNLIKHSSNSADYSLYDAAAQQICTPFLIRRGQAPISRRTSALPPEDWPPNRAATPIVCRAAGP